MNGKIEALGQMMSFDDLIYDEKTQTWITPNFSQFTEPKAYVDFATEESKTAFSILDQSNALSDYMLGQMYSWKIPKDQDLFRMQYRVGFHITTSPSNSPIIP
jgi:hypothetical protein